MRKYDTTTTTIIPQSQSSGGQLYESSISILLHLMIFHSNTEYIHSALLGHVSLHYTIICLLTQIKGFSRTRSFLYLTLISIVKLKYTKNLHPHRVLISGNMLHPEHKKNKIMIGVQHINMALDKQIPASLPRGH